MFKWTYLVALFYGALLAFDALLYVVAYDLTTAGSTMVRVLYMIAAPTLVVIVVLGAIGSRVSPAEFRFLALFGMLLCGQGALYGDSLLLMSQVLTQVVLATVIPQPAVRTLVGGKR